MFVVRIPIACLLPEYCTSNNYDTVILVLSLCVDHLCRNNINS